MLVLFMDKFWGMLYSLSIWFDSIVYNLIDTAYQVFMILAGNKIINSSEIADITGRIYILVGVVVLFVLAYSMLTALINPDNISKGNAAPGKLVKKIAIALICLVFTPSVFGFMNNIQEATLENDDIMSNIILGDDFFGDLDPEKFTLAQNGKSIAIKMFTPFLSVAEDYNEDEIEGKYEGEDIKFSEVNEIVIKTDVNPFNVYRAFGENIAAGELSYTPILPIAFGAVLLWFFASFCIDLAVRSVKLVYLELIAPLPIIMSMMPKKDDLLKNWFIKTISTFLEVYIRLGIMYLACFLIKHVDTIFNPLAGADATGAGEFAKTLATAMMIVGIVIFGKQAPKLISETLGLKGDMKLGIKDKLKDGGVYRAGSALGAGTQSAIRGFNQNKGLRKLSGAAGGALGGIARGFKQGGSANNFSGMRKSAREAVEQTDARRYANMQKRAERAAMNETGGFTGAVGAHVKQMQKRAAEWAGTSVNASDRRAVLKNFDSQRKAYEDEAEKAAVENGFKSSIYNLGGTAEETFKNLDEGKALYEKYLSRPNGRGYASFIDDYNKYKATGVKSGIWGNMTSTELESFNKSWRKGMTAKVIDASSGMSMEDQINKYGTAINNTEENSELKFDKIRSEGKILADRAMEANYGNFSSESRGKGLSFKQVDEANKKYKDEADQIRQQDERKPKK